MYLSIYMDIWIFVYAIYLYIHKNIHCIYPFWIGSPFDFITQSLALHEKAKHPKNMFLYYSLAICSNSFHHFLKPFEDLKPPQTSLMLSVMLCVGFQQSPHPHPPIYLLLKLLINFNQTWWRKRGNRTIQFLPTSVSIEGKIIKRAF